MFHFIIFADSSIGIDAHKIESNIETNFAPRNVHELLVMEILNFIIIWCDFGGFQNFSEQLRFDFFLFYPLKTLLMHKSEVVFLCCYLPK